MKGRTTMSVHRIRVDYRLTYIRGLSVDLEDSGRYGKPLIYVNR